MYATLAVALMKSQVLWEVTPHSVMNGTMYRRADTGGRLLGMRIRIPPEAWMPLFCECCVMSGRGLWVGPITRPEESYRVWRV